MSNVIRLYSKRNKSLPMVAKEIDKPTSAYNKSLNNNNKSIFIFPDSKSVGSAPSGHGIILDNIIF